jgi:pimeloyl-ACP methyl ester carboxylesterase
MDQRNANGGESSGPIPVHDPWGAFADDQLGLMNHLGIREFFFMGYCIGGPFALKLMERASDRVVAGVLCQPVGHRPENTDVMYNSGRDVWAPELRARRPEVTMATEWHAGLASEMHDDATGNVLAAVRKAPIELEGFEQNGETEPSGTRLVGEQFTLVGSQRPVLGEFIRVPVLLHRN